MTGASPRSSPLCGGQTLTDFGGKRARARGENDSGAFAIGDLIASRFTVDAARVDDKTYIACDEESGERIRLLQMSTPRTVVLRRAVGLEQSFLASVVDVVEQGGETWLAVAEAPPRYEPLRDLLARERRLEPTQAVSFILRVCGALDALHAAGVVHGEVTVDNLMVCEDDGFDPLLGFGASGPPGCQRPESVDSRFVEADDTWGVAALLYTLLLGDLPSAWGLERGRLVGDLDDRELGGILEQALCSVEEVRTTGLPILEAELEDWLVSKLGEGSLPQIAVTIPPPLPHFPAVAKLAGETTSVRRTSPSRGFIFGGAAIFVGAVLGFVVTLAIAEKNQAVTGSAWPDPVAASDGHSARVVDLPAVEVSAHAGELSPAPVALCVAELIPHRVVNEAQSATLCSPAKVRSATSFGDEGSDSWTGFQDLGHFNIPTLETLRLGCCAEPPLLTIQVAGCEQLGQAARNLARDVLAGADYGASLKSYESVAFCLPSRPVPGDLTAAHASAFERFAQSVRVK
jgi:hypothetical protein